MNDADTGTAQDIKKQKQNCIYLVRAEQNQRLESEKHAAWEYVSGSSENLSRSDRRQTLDELDWKIWESFFRIRALPRNIQASAENVRKEIGPALEKKAETISLESVCWGDTMYCNGCHDSCKKKRMIKLNESCSVVVTVKSSTIFCRYCDDVLNRKKRTGWVSAVQSPRTWKHVYIFSRLSCFPFNFLTPQAEDCMTKSAMLND